MLLVSLESWKPKTTELCVCVTKLWVAPKGGRFVQLEFEASRYRPSPQGQLRFRFPSPVVAARA